MNLEQARAMAERYKGGRTRKLVIDIDLEAETEEALDVVEAKLREEFIPSDSVVIYQDINRNITMYRITSSEVVNEGEVEI